MLAVVRVLVVMVPDVLAMEETVVDKEFEELTCTEEVEVSGHHVV